VNPANPKKPLVPYLRQSRAKEHVISFEQQWDAIQSWATANGADLSVASLAEADAAGLVERGVSGNKRWQERVLGQVIETCERGEASGVIIYDQSRLSREDLLGTAQVWDALDKAKADLIDATGGGKVKRMVYVIKAEMAREQWEKSRERGIDSAIRATKAGKRVGPTPIGYRREEGKLLPHGDPADPKSPAGVVRRVFELRASGKATDRELTEMLNGIPSARRRNGVNKHGRSFTRNVLTSPTYKGLLKWGDVEVQVEEMRIVSDAVWLRAQRPRQRGVKSKRNDILQGLVRCHLGHRMSVTSNQNGLFWRCGNDACEKPARINHRNLQRLVVGQVLDHYLGVFEKPRAPEDRTPELEAAVAEARGDLAEVEALKDTVKLAAYVAGLSDAMETLEEAERALAEYVPPVVGDVPPKAILVKLRETAEVDNEAALEQIRNLCQRTLNKVTVLPGRAPAEERVIIEWQDGERTGAVTSGQQGQDSFDEAFDHD
jgi:DNA invertase Pin-like site-specific DNA recombinase